MKNEKFYWSKNILVTIQGLIMALYSLSCFAQNDWATDQEWKDILTKHQSGKISDTTYLLKAQVLTEKSFKDPSLKEKLSMYRKIAWSESAYQAYRVKYFAFLANHTTFIHQDGFSIYYLEKMEEELQKIKPYISSLNQPRLLLSIYGSNDLANYNKRIAIIDSLAPFLKSLPEKLSTQTVSINTCINAFTILKQSSQLFLAMKDTARVLDVLNISQQIWNELVKKDSLDRGKLEQCRLSLYLIECAGARVVSDAKTEGEILNKAYQVIISQNSQVSSLFKRSFERTILGRLIDYHLDYNQLDSANYYFFQFRSKLDSYKKSENGDGTKFFIYSGKVHAKNGDYISAYRDILHAYKMNDSIITIRTADIHNNMYAHLVAEQRNDALKIAAQQKSDQNLIIYVISALLMLTVCIFTLKLNAGRKKSREQIEELNNITQIQIAEMEARANLVQKKMGMELHDDIAGRLVNICNFIETQMLEENDHERISTLLTIGDMTKETYANTRLKSHDWYFRSLVQETMDFSQRVSKIVHLALPDGRYEKQIEIDEQSLQQVSPEIRISLLRIIQEAVANILKHAKASKVKFFLYEEDGNVVLQISDNGRGFDSEIKHKGLGIRSLNDRIKEMNGSLEILSSDEGTELLFLIPMISK